MLGLMFVCNGVLIVLLFTFLPCGLERCIVLILVRHWLVLVGRLVYCLVEMLVVLYFVCWSVGGICWLLLDVDAWLLFVCGLQVYGSEVSCGWDYCGCVAILWVGFLLWCRLVVMLVSY